MSEPDWASLADKVILAVEKRLGIEADGTECKCEEEVIEVLKHVAIYGYLDSAEIAYQWSIDGTPTDPHHPGVYNLKISQAIHARVAEIRGKNE